MFKKVRFFDYPLQFKAHQHEYTEIIRNILSRGAYILGKDLEEFEVNLAKFCKCRYAIGVANCTDALLLSLYAAHIGTGDEVICVSHTFSATIEVVKLLGARPVFVDIGDDHNMDVDLVQKVLTSKTKAIIPVHLNGRICSNMDKLLKIAKKHNLLIIEDAAQSLGATYKGKGAGTFGLSGCFSFYPAKLLGAFGDAGAVITGDGKFAEKIRMLRNHGRAKGPDIHCWGLNGRMDNLQAGILNYKLKKVSGWIKRRRQIAGLYNLGLSGLKELQLPLPPKENITHYDVFQNYEIEAQRRDALIKHLQRKNIQVAIPWGGKAVHQFTALGFKGVCLPKTEALFRKVLMLPIYPELENSQIAYIVRTIRDFYQ